MVAIQTVCPAEPRLFAAVLSRELLLTLLGCCALANKNTRGPHKFEFQINSNFSQRYTFVCVGR